ncbi:MAG: FecR family protein [Polyangiales bacterium]
MGELSSKIEQAREHVSVHWDEAREARVRAAIDAQPRRRPIAPLVAAACVLVALGGAWLRRRATAPSHDSPSSVAPIVLADGTRAQLIDPRGELQVVRATDREVVLRLQRGRARFSVAHRESRVFRVEVGSLAVQVLGTTFDVERIDDGRARVRVSEGRVRVLWPEHHRDVAAGESGEFPQSNVAADTAPIAPVAEPRAADTSDASTPSTVVVSARSNVAVSSARARENNAWRALAESGRYDDAWRAIEPVSARSIDTVNDLLLASDVARLSGHPEQATRFLQEILRTHASDPRAAMAAFTLGRVLIDELGRPREAAESFARVASLDHAGTFGEDALARQVEAWSRAGDSARAREAAAEYVRLFPEGRSLRRVRRWGALE